LRKVVSGYTGNAINITRASDSKSTDIGFDSKGNLNTSAVTSFCAGTTCTVNTIYDQSPQGYNATCTGGPIIYTAGAIETSGTVGRPAMLFNGSNYCGTPASFYYYGMFATVQTVANFSVSSGAYENVVSFMSDGNLSYTNRSAAIPIQKDDTNESVVITRYNSQGVLATNITYGTPSVIAAMFGSRNETMYVDETTAPGIYDNLPLGYRFYLNSIWLANQSTPPAGSFHGLISEMIVFDDMLSSEAYANLQANEKAYYGTP
jgi:hypothetical protein